MSKRGNYGRKNQFGVHNQNSSGQQYYSTENPYAPPQPQQQQPTFVAQQPAFGQPINNQQNPYAQYQNTGYGQPMTQQYAAQGHTFSRGRGSRPPMTSGNPYSMRGQQQRMSNPPTMSRSPQQNQSYHPSGPPRTSNPPNRISSSPNKQKINKSDPTKTSRNQQRQQQPREVREQPSSMMGRGSGGRGKGFTNRGRGSRRGGAAWGSSGGNQQKQQNQNQQHKKQNQNQQKKQKQNQQKQQQAMKKAAVVVKPQTNRPKQPKISKPKPVAQREESDSDGSSDELDSLDYMCQDLDLDNEKISDWVENSDENLRRFLAQTYFDICAFSAQVPTKLNTKKQKQFWNAFRGILKREFNCPKHIVNGGNKQITSWLLTELQTVKLIGPQDFEDINSSQSEELAQVSEKERKQLKEIGQQLANICHKLHIDGDNGPQVILNTTEYVKHKVGDGYIQTPLLHGENPSKFQYDIMSQINDDFCQQYTARKEMLKVRFVALLDSMKKSQKIGGEIGEELETKTTRLMEGLDNPADIETWAAFGAQQDLFLSHKINYSLRPNVIRPFVMKGKVKGKGGRPDEIKKKDIDAIPFGNFGGGKRGGRGGKRGGKGGRRGGGNRQGGGNRNYGGNKGGYNNRRGGGRN